MHKLLIVDDQAPLREILSFAFEDEYEIKTACDGHEALDLVRDWQPDVVLTDFVMPGLTGLEFVGSIRADVWPLKNTDDLDAQQAEARLKPQVILYSALMTQDLAKQAKSAGVQICLTKPFDLADLKNKIRSLIEV